MYIYDSYYEVHIYIYMYVLTNSEMFTNIVSSNIFFAQLREVDSFSTIVLPLVCYLLITD